MESINLAPTASYATTNSYHHLIAALATGLGVFGGFPTAPKIFQDWAKNPIFQWGLVFIWIWQGNGGAGLDWDDLMITTFITLVLYFVKQVLDYNYDKIKEMGF
jgi:hypothetical protein